MKIEKQELIDWLQSLAWSCKETARERADANDFYTAFIESNDAELYEALIDQLNEEWEE